MGLLISIWPHIKIPRIEELALHVETLPLLAEWGCPVFVVQHPRELAAALLQVDLAVTENDGKICVDKALLLRHDKHIQALITETKTRGTNE